MACFETCTEKTTRRRIVFSEHGKTAYIENCNSEQLERTKFDGCVDCDGRRADYVLRDVRNRAVIIELKGKNVHDAEEQILNTAKFLRDNGKLSERPAVLIVCARVPLGVSAVQRITLRLKKGGIGKTKVKSREWCGAFDSLV